MSFSSWLYTNDNGGRARLVRHGDVVGDVVGAWRGPLSHPPHPPLPAPPPTPRPTLTWPPSFQADLCASLDITDGLRGARVTRVARTLRALVGAGRAPPPPPPAGRQITTVDHLLSLSLLSVLLFTCVGLYLLPAV